jgi:stage III sporulation protein SpoIIIAA
MFDDLVVNKYDYKNIINKTTILIGRSQSGKSVLIRDVLYNIKDEIPVCLVICPTEL